MESSGPTPPLRQEHIAQNCSGRMGIEDILDLLSTVNGVFLHQIAFQGLITSGRVSFNTSLGSLGPI